MGAAILDGASHDCQLPRQGVCQLSIRALGGGPSSFSIHADDDDNDNYCMVTQISRFAGRLVGGVRGLKKSLEKNLKWGETKKSYFVILGQGSTQ